MKLHTGQNEDEMTANWNGYNGMRDDIVSMQVPDRILVAGKFYRL